MDFQNYIDSKILFFAPIYFRSEKQHSNNIKKEFEKYIKDKEALYNKLKLEITGKDRIDWDIRFHTYI